MDHKDIRKQAEEIKKELGSAEEDIRKSKGPIYTIIGIVLILLIVLMAIPVYNMNNDPEPGNIPKYEDVVPKEIRIIQNATAPKTYEQYRYLYNPRDEVIKQLADKIATSSCKSGEACYAKAIFYFVRDELSYVPDPAAYEYVKSARETLKVRGGDCDDASILLANMLGSIGIRARLVFIPGHVYVQIYLPDAADRYKDQGWINLDATCESCSFGEILSDNRDKQKVMIDL